MDNKTKLIAAFPGLGKTYFFNNNIINNKIFKISDSDSSSFSKDPSFPKNYFEHIDNLISTNEYDYIFISTHEKVLEYLNNNYENFLIVIPILDRKEEMLEIYKNRNNTEAFINLLDINYEKWILEIINKYNNKVCTLSKNVFLKDILS